MPRGYAPANKLYRGYLPQEFRDPTWIEEWVCAKYSNTAVVTRLRPIIGPIPTRRICRIDGYSAPMRAP